MKSYPATFPRLLSLAALPLTLLGLAAPAAQAQNVTINRLQGSAACTIDGVVDAVWSTAAPAVAITKPTGSISGASDLSGSWRVVSDDFALYLLVDVNDDTKTNDSANPWDDDSVEVYIDGLNNKSTSYDANDRQYIFGYGDSAVVEPAGRNAAGVFFAKADPTATSYRIEMQIPWSTIGVDPATSVSIGIDVHINDDDNGGARDGKLAWADGTDRAWTNPATFGNGTLQTAPPPPPPPPLPAAAAPVFVAAEVDPADPQHVISLSWTNVSSGTPYAAEYAQGSSGMWTRWPTPVAGGAAGIRQGVAVTGLSAGVTYSLRVVALSVDGLVIATSETVQVTTPILPVLAAPTDFSGSPGGSTAVMLFWKHPVSTVDRFTIEVGSSIDGPWVENPVTVGTPLFLSSIIWNLQPSTIYWFRVRVSLSAGGSPPSEVIAVRTSDETPPAPPTINSASALSGTEIRVQWSPGSPLNSTSGVLERAPSNSGPWTVVATGVSGPSVAAGGLVAGTRYWFRVREPDGVGDWLYSSATQCLTRPAEGTLFIAYYNKPGLVVDGTLIAESIAYNEPVLLGEVPLTKQLGAISGPEDLESRLIPLWTDRYLHLFLAVEDSEITNDSTDPRDDDSVEVFLNFGNEATPAYDANDRHFVFGIGDTGVVEVRGRSTAGVQFASISNQGRRGYVIEIVIPWAVLGGSPVNGASLGFDVRVNDDDDGGVRDGSLAWNDATGGATTDPRLFGIGKLEVASVPRGSFVGADEADIESTAVNLFLGFSSSNTKSVRIERSTSTGGPWVVLEQALPVDPATITEFSGQAFNFRYRTSGLTPATQYYFRVQAGNAAGVSDFSIGTIVTKPAAGAPEAPTQLTATANPSGGVSLTWTDRATNETAFTVEKHVLGGPWTIVATLPANASSYRATGLPVGVWQAFRIQAAGPAGKSAYSNEAYGTPVADASVPVTGVAVSPTSATLSINASTTLTPTISPANASIKAVTWTTSNAAVATVSPAGVVNAISSGTATITATTQDGGKTAAAVITVSPPVVPVTGLSVSPVIASLPLGASATLTATLTPANATNRTVIWTSSNPAVIKIEPLVVIQDFGVDANGNAITDTTRATVIALAVGTATITATAQGGSVTTTITLTVLTQNPVTGVSVAPTAVTVNLPATTSLTAIVTPVTALNKNVSWSTSNPAIATVSPAGVVTPVSVGTVSITATTQQGGFTAASTVTVVSHPEPVSGVSVSPGSATLSSGGSTTLTATVAPAYASNKTVSWSTSNAAVATVSPAGVVSALGTGVATITITTQDGGKTATSVITVTDVAPPGAVQRLEGESGVGSAESFVFVDDAASGGEARGGIDAVGTYVEWAAVPASRRIVVGYFAPDATSLAVLVNGVKQATLALPASLDWAQAGLDLAIPAGATVRLLREAADGAFADIDYIELTRVNMALVTALNTTSAINVNGSLAESVWSVTTPVAKSAAGSNNNTATFGVLWDANRLYIGVKVLDATIRTNRPNVWDNDSVEVLIDGNFNKGATYDAADVRVVKQANSNTVWTSRPIPGLQHARSVVTGGYTVEIAIPWSAIGGLPAAGGKIGFDVLINDNDLGTGAAGRLVWSGDLDNRASTVKFGELLLSPAVAGVLAVPPGN